MDTSKTKDGKKMETKAMEISVIKKNEAIVLNEAVSYVLLKIDFEYGRVYAITVSNSSESGEAFVGKNESRAADIYNVICKNEVTPCTFLDIIEDFRVKIQ